MKNYLYIHKIRNVQLLYALTFKKQTYLGSSQNGIEDQQKRIDEEYRRRLDASMPRTKP